MGESLKITGVLALSFLYAAAFSAPPAKKKEILSLSELISRALTANAELKMKDQDIALAANRITKIEAYKLPTIENVSLVAPIYKDIGNALTHEEDKDKWGYFVKTTTTIVQPIYGFGRFKYYMGAAKEGVNAEKHQKKMKVSDVIYDVKQYYYGAQATSSGLVRLEETEEKLVEVIKRVDELLKMESGEVRKEDAYKLKALLQELRVNKEKIIKGSQLARAALQYKAGIPTEVDFDVQEKELKREEFELKPLDHYQNLALKHRPEMAALKAGIEARHSMVEAERSNKLPLFFIGGLIDVADTANHIRNRQDSPYAYDPYNRITPGFGLGFKWNLDIWKVNAEIEREKAEYFKLIHQKELAEQGIPTEVKKAYLEYQEAQNVIAHAKEQQGQTKKWFMQSVFAWGFGVGDSREVLESVIFKGFSDKNYYESLYNHNVAISALTRATGTELLPNLKY